MALEYEMPIMTCDGVEEPVEHVWAKYRNSSGLIREHYFRELTLHQLFYPCERLRSELRRAALTEGYKRYEKVSDESGEWSSKQPPNFMLISELEYYETDFKTSKVVKKKGAIDRRLLFGWIKNYFRPEDKQKYAWYALWLLLKDKGIVNNNDLTLFAKQMVTWFPSLFPNGVDDEIKSLAKAIRIYNRILGDNPDMWDDGAILTIINDPKRGVGASEQGYSHIKKTFFNLRSLLLSWKIIMKEGIENV